MARKLLNISELSSSQTQTGAYALILEVNGSNKRIPIIIGAYEAQAIALQLEGLKPSRPLTHDLFQSFTNAFNISVIEVEINRFSEGVFYSRIICFDGAHKVEIDSRTSDAIALAVRFNCPIYCDDEVVKETAIEMENEDEEDEFREFEIDDLESDEEELNEPTLLSMDELEALLQKMIEEENYEEASRIRDEINQRKNK
ncbi:MAG: bifunctional nuclease family protein [Bacteroidales bacterium]|nr:bifunctional nuclease family protein [Bacteroidales bacterium]